METIELIYKRLPDRVNHFPQNLLYEDDDVIVTTQRIKPSSPIIIDGVTVLGITTGQFGSSLPIAGMTLAKSTILKTTSQGTTATSFYR